MFREIEQKSPAVARKDALQSVQFLLQYWLSKSSKVDVFHVIWKTICHFLLVINNNLSLISQSPKYGKFSVENAHFSYPLHLTLNKKCSLALDRWNVTCLGLRHRGNYSCKKIFLYDLPFSHNTDSRTDGQTDDTSCQRCPTA